MSRGHSPLNNFWRQCLLPPNFFVSESSVVTTNQPSHRSCNHDDTDFYCLLRAFSFCFAACLLLRIVLTPGALKLLRRCCGTSSIAHSVNNLFCHVKQHLINDTSLPFHQRTTDQQHLINVIQHLINDTSIPFRQRTTDRPFEFVNLCPLHPNPLMTQYR